MRKSKSQFKFYRKFAEFSIIRSSFFDSTSFFESEKKISRKKKFIRCESRNPRKKNGNIYHFGGEKENPKYMNLF